MCKNIKFLKWINIISLFPSPNKRIFFRESLQISRAEIEQCKVGSKLQKEEVHMSTLQSFDFWLNPKKTSVWPGWIQSSVQPRFFLQTPHAVTIPGYPSPGIPSPPPSTTDWKINFFLIWIPKWGPQREYLPPAIRSSLLIEFNSVYLYSTYCTV